MKYNPAPITRTVALLSILLIIQPGISLGEKTAAEYYKEGLQLFPNCFGDGFEPELCGKAIVELERAIELDPTLTDAYLTLARAYWNKSSFDVESEQEGAALQEKAHTLTRRAVAMDPNNVKALEALKFHTKDEDEKLSLIKKIIELDPKHPRAHGSLAGFLMWQGKVDEAIEEYRIHLEVSPYRTRGDGRRHITFGKSLAQAGRLKEAVEVFEKTLILARDEPRVERCVLAEPIDLELYSAFKEFVDKVEKLRPYCTNDEHLDRAFQLLHQGKLDEAIEELQLQLKVNPYYVETYGILEGIYKRQGEIDKALEVVKMSIEIEEDPLERCKRYMRYKGYDYLGEEIFERFDQKLLEQLKRECESSKE